MASCHHKTDPNINTNIKGSKLYDIVWTVDNSKICLTPNEYRKLANNMEIIQNYMNSQQIINGR